MTPTQISLHYERGGKSFKISNTFAACLITPKTGNLMIPVDDLDFPHKQKYRRGFVEQQ